LSAFTIWRVNCASGKPARRSPSICSSIQSPALGDLLRRLDERLLVLDRGLRRGADDPVDELVGARARERDRVAEEVLRGAEVRVRLVLRDRLAVGALDHPLLEGAVEAQREAVLDRVVPEEDLAPQELLRDDVLRIADDARDRLADTVARRDRGA
jgi:hypothetical protein